MKAFALTSPDQPAALVDLPEPELAPAAVRIRVRAASVNGFDVYQASGGLLAMMEHALPTVIGRDFAGVIDAVGSGQPMSPWVTRYSASSPARRRSTKARTPI